MTREEFHKAYEASIDEQKACFRRLHAIDAEQRDLANRFWGLRPGRVLIADGIRYAFVRTLGVDITGKTRPAVCVNPMRADGKGFTLRTKNIWAVNWHWEDEANG